MEDRNLAGILLVGSGVVMNGTIHAPKAISNSGNIEGNITSEQIIITENGTIKGNLIADEIDVFGSAFENISAKKDLIIRSSGNASGTIAYSNLSVEKGGKLAGSLNVMVAQNHSYEDYSYTSSRTEVVKDSEVFIPNHTVQKT